MIIEKTISFEVAAKDAPELMDFDEATKWAASLGEGWRLPTREELNLLYERREEIGGFSTDSGSYAGWYWSSTLSVNGDVWCQRFSDGFESGYRLSRLSARAVRSAPRS